MVSESLHCCLLREIRANPKIKYRDLQLNLDLNKKTVSKATLYRILKKKGIINWLAKQRPLITEEVAAKYLQFVKDHEHWDARE